MIRKNPSYKTSVRRGYDLHARTVQDTGARIRVGDAVSPVQAGDPAPGGGVYRAGQYSPRVEDLAAATFSSAKDAGILPSGIPIFDEDGEVNKDKLEKWNPNSFNISIKFDDDVPKYSSAVLVSTFSKVEENVLDSFNLNVMQAPRTLGEFGNYIIAAKTFSTNRRFYSTLYVYPDFYKYIDKPIVPKTPKRDSGLSVSSFMTFHSLGHILFSKLTFEGRLHDISDFLETSGWMKTSDYKHTKSSFMGKKSTSAWYKNSHNKFLSELSMYSPMDDFAQAFAFYYTSRDYFSTVDQEKFDVMHKIISEHI